MPNQDNLGFVAKVPFKNEEGEFEYVKQHLNINNNGTKSN